MPEPLPLGPLVGAEQADPRTHVFAGMWRPPISELRGGGRGPQGLVTTTGRYLMGTEQTFVEAYQNGEFDRPLYRQVVELRNDDSQSENTQEDSFMVSYRESGGDWTYDQDFQTEREARAHIQRRLDFQNSVQNARRAEWRVSSHTVIDVPLP